jgi:hypothetical protein
VKDNAVLLDLLEKIKGMDGVKDVVWSEIVSVVGRKRSIPSSIIDKMIKYKIFNSAGGM